MEDIFNNIVDGDRKSKNSFLNEFGLSIIESML